MEQKFKLGDVVKVKSNGFVFKITIIKQKDSGAINYSSDIISLHYNQDNLELVPIKKELSREDIEKAWNKAMKKNKDRYIDFGQATYEALIKELGL